MADAPDFIDQFQETIEEAVLIVKGRDADGRNKAVSPEEQFLRSDRKASQMVMDLIEMKIARARSYLKAGNWPKYKEELDDCINYSAFAIVFEDQPGEYYLRGEWDAAHGNKPVPEGGFAKGIQAAGRGPHDEATQ